MNQIEKAINDLSSPDKNTRYEACDELRVADSLPEPAITALEVATHDPDPLVADAARRALAIHKPPLPTESSHLSSQDRLINETPIGNKTASFSLGAGIISVFLLLIPYILLIGPFEWGSRIEGLIMLTCCSNALSVIPTTLAIMSGIVSLRKTKKSGGVGDSKATVGIALGVLSIALFYFFWHNGFGQ